LEPLESLDVRQADGFADMLRRMSKTAFGGRALGEAFEVFSTMAEDADCTIVLTVSGAMTVGKMDMVLCEMIDAGLADLIVTTGAILAHGLSADVGGVHYKCDPQVPDQQLYQWGYNRVYDTVEMEANLCQAEETVREVMQTLDWSRPTCSHVLNRQIGRRLAEQNQMPSMLGSAYRRGVPVYVPALTDSELLVLASAPLQPLFGPVRLHAPRARRTTARHLYDRRRSSPQLGSASRTVRRHHQLPIGNQPPRAAIPLRREDLPGTRPLGRPQRLHLQRGRLLGQVSQPGRGRPLRRSVLRRDHRLAPARTRPA